VRRTKTAEARSLSPKRRRWRCARGGGQCRVAAASTILTKSVKGEVADNLLAKGIAEVREKLN